PWSPLRPADARPPPAEQPVVPTAWDIVPSTAIPTSAPTGDTLRRRARAASSAVRRDAAVDGDQAAGQVRPGAGGEEDRDPRHVFRASRAPTRDVTDVVRVDHVLEEETRHLRREQPGR